MVSGQVPGQVARVTVTASDGLVVLKWQAAPGKPTGYQVVVSPAPAAGQARPRSASVTSVPFGQPLTTAAPSAEALPIGATGAGSQSSATATTFAVNVTVGSSTGNGSQITGYTIYAYKAASSSGPWTEVSSAPVNARGGGMPTAAA